MLFRSYREAVDVLWDQGEEEFKSRLPHWLKEMDKASHRDFSTGFIFGKPGAESHNIETSNYIREYSFVGRSLSPEEIDAVLEEYPAQADKEGTWIEQRNIFYLGDELEVLSPQGDPWTFEVTGMCDEEGAEVEVARHAQQKLRILTPKPLEPYTILRKYKKTKPLG